MKLATRDVGLGTFYERWAIYRRLRTWKLDVASAFEGPVDGMAGMPGLHLLGLARSGTRVCVAHPDPMARRAVASVYESAGLSERLQLAEAIPDAQFELALGFNFATYVPDWRSHLGDLARVSTRWLVVMATHPHSYGAWIRRGLRRLEPGAVRPEQFDHESCRPEILRRELRRFGRVEAEAYVDCPWWPDLFVSAGQTLLSASTARFGGRSQRAHTAFDFGPEDYPFAAESLTTEHRAALRRHPGFDSFGGATAGVFAHHRAYLVRVG